MKKYYLISAYFVLLFVLVFSAVGISFTLLYPHRYESEITLYAKKYNLDPALVASVINVESGFDKNKVSPVGAIGLMQLMPTTAVEIAAKNGVAGFTVSDLYEVETNIDFGCYYLNYLQNFFEGNLTNVLASYNAGLNNVNAWLLDVTYSEDGYTIEKTPYTETNNFINRVNSNYKIYSKRY